MPTDSPKKCVPQPHKLVTAGIEVIVRAIEKSTDTTTTTAMLPIGEETIFIQRPASSGQEKRGDHKQTVNIEVSSNDVVEFLPDLTTFHAGNLREFFPSWRKITSDINILDYVSGVKISFEEGLVPCQAHYRPSVFNAQEELIVRQEIKTLLEKGVIQHSHHEPGEFISTIFLRPKPDGSFRMILNLKEFNKSVEHHHFKMDTLDTVTKMIEPGCYMASVDLKDAYYTVVIHKDHQKFLKFEFKGCEALGGAVASWLVRSTSEQTVRVRALAGDIVLCSWARHFTLMVPLSTQVYKWVPANLMLGVTLRWTSIPSRGE